MTLLLQHKPEDALKILRGERPDSAPPEDDGPMTDDQFWRTDLWFHHTPPSVQNGRSRQ